jgi:hypothetical protein
MKKIICLIAVVLMIASVAIAQKKGGITAKDLPALKGTYEGRVTFGIQVEAATSAAKLEILTDAVPVKARLTIDDIPGQIAGQLGLMSGKNVFENDDGVITTAGTVMFTGKSPKNFFEVSDAGAKKVKCLYYFQGLRGDALFNKK